MALALPMLPSARSDYYRLSRRARRALQRDLMRLLDRDPEFRRVKSSDTKIEASHVKIVHFVSFSWHLALGFVEEVAKRAVRVAFVISFVPLFDAYSRGWN